MALPTETMAPTGMPRLWLDPMTSSAMAPDSEISATPPPRGMSRKNVLAQGLARSSRSMSPAQLGPAIVRPCACASSRSARSRAWPSSPPSAKPPGEHEEVVMAARRGFARHVENQVRPHHHYRQLAGRRHLRKGGHDRQAEQLAALGFTGTMRPRYPDLRRLRSTAPPELPGRSPAPTTATLAGRRNAERRLGIEGMLALLADQDRIALGAEIVPGRGLWLLQLTPAAVRRRGCSPAPALRQLTRAPSRKSPVRRSRPRRPAPRPQSRPESSPRWPSSP